MPQQPKDLYLIINDTLGNNAFKNAHVLDVGCFRFEESIAMKDAGATVTALDIKDRPTPPEGISFIHSDFLKWEPGENDEFDIIHLSRSALFMPNKDVMEKIATLNPKTIAVRTMSAYPEPNWPPEVLLPLYFTTPQDWSAFFEPLGFKTVYAESYDDHGPDMHGVPRLFHLIDYIGTKP